MKILALTPMSQNKIQLNSKNSNFFVNKNVNYDSVSFQAGKKAAAKKAGAKMFDGFLDNIGGELGAKVKELMSGKESRPVFMTMLVSLAATATELILKNGARVEIEEDKTEKNDDDKKKTRAKKEKPAAEKEKPVIEKEKPAAKKGGRKSIVEKMGEENFIAKLQEMVNKGYTLSQIGEVFGGLSISSVSKYIKYYHIEKKVVGDNSAVQNAPKTGRKTYEEKLKDFMEAQPYRREYIQKLEAYPELQAQYKKAVENMVTDSKNEFYISALSGMEKVYKNLFALKSKFNKPFLEQFNEKYGTNFDKVCVIFDNIAGDKTLPECLAEFKDNDYSEDLIDRWVKYPAFTPEELEMTEELPLVNTQAIHKLKQSGCFSFQIMKNEKYHNYSFMLKFKDNVDLTEKLKSISEFHEALYDNIYLHKDRGNKVQRIVDIQEELQNHLVKDKNLDSIYNILKFVVPEEMENVDYQTENYVPLSELEVVNSNAKKQMETVIANLDIKNNSKLQDLEDVLNDKGIFRDLIDNNHAKLRFISRFVLNKKIPDDDLYQSCDKAVGVLANKMDKKLNSGCLIFPYTMNDSTAPSFYLDKCSLGDFIKITLNNQGQIHTIFEDLKRKTSFKQ